MLVSVGLVVLSLPVLAWAGYLAALALLSRECRRPASSASDTPGTRFDVVVPAHDEAIGIASTVESLLAVDYPPALRRVIVVADNCVDDTGARAAAAGATVITRDDPIPTRQGLRARPGVRALAGGASRRRRRRRRRRHARDPEPPSGVRRQAASWRGSGASGILRCESTGFVAHPADAHRLHAIS